ncbi:MAG: GspMb/PilO family protein [Phycisphaeraceae bacterium]
MQMSRREKLIALVTLALIVLFLGDRLVVAPALAYRTQLAAEAQLQAEQRAVNERLYDGLASLETRWRDLRAAGLTDGAADAEARLLQAVRGWASEAGLSVTSLVPDRIEPADRLPRVHVRVVGTGDMRQVVTLLSRLEAADLPVRIEEMQLSARREGADELTLNLRLTTLYVTDPPAADPRPRRARS